MKSLRHGGSTPSNAPARCGLENISLSTIKHLRVCWTFADSAPPTKNAFDSTIPKRSSGETFLSQSRCLRSCGSRCCSPGRFRDRGLVAAVAAKGNKHAKTHKKCWERSWPYLVGKTESSQESRDRNRGWMMMNDHDHDGSSLPPKLSGQRFVHDHEIFLGVWNLGCQR